MQDYTGDLEIALFSDGYQRFKSFFEEGASLFISGTWQQRYNSEEMELRVSEVRLLESVGADLTESITVSIPLALLNTSLLDRFEAACRQHKGKHQLKVKLLDYDNQSSLQFISGDRKVHADSDFIESIGKLGLAYALN